MNAAAETKHTPGPCRVVGGTWDGQPIRRARKHYRCDYWKGALNGGRCKNAIEPGDFYMEAA